MEEDTIELHEIKLKKNKKKISHQQESFLKPNSVAEI